MSWSASYAEPIRGANVAEDLCNDRATCSPPMDGWHPHVKEQFGAARAAAIGLIESGAVGSPERSYRVNLSGHSNPDHKPQAGWSNDTVYVSVTQMPPESGGT